MLILNPKAQEVVVDGKIYAITWQDFSEFVRLNVFQDEKRIGFRDLPLRTDMNYKTVRYLIRRMVGDYGPIKKAYPNVGATIGRWGSAMRKMF